MLSNSDRKKIWIKNFVPIFLKPVKKFQQINYMENIIYSRRICRNNFYWSNHSQPENARLNLYIQKLNLFEFRIFKIHWSYGAAYVYYFSPTRLNLKARTIINIPDHYRSQNIKPAVNNNYPCSKSPSVSILADTENIQNKNFSQSQAKCMQVCVILKRAFYQA